MRNLFLLLCLAFIAFPASACRRPTPNANSLSSYSSIFIAEVVGIHLVDYESALLKKPNLISIANNTPSFQTNLVIDEVLRGEVKSSSAKLTLGGCLVQVPELKQKGIFFVRQDGKTSVAILDNDPKYAYWLSLLKPGK
jgi:hypothetical protein